MRIEDEWKSYAATVIPENASDVQIDECRLAFYAGCNSMFSLLSRVKSDEPAAIIVAIAALDKELRDFYQTVAERVQ